MAQIIKCDYEWTDAQIHKARLLLGDPTAEKVEHVLEYARRINKQNDGKTNYNIYDVLVVAGQPSREPHKMVAMALYGSVVPYPTVEQVDAIGYLIGGSTILSASKMFTEPGRGEGATLRLAVEALHNMLKTPGVPVLIKDHYDSPEGDRELVDVVGRLCKSVGIETFLANHVDHNSFGRIHKMSINPPPKPKVIK